MKLPRKLKPVCPDPNKGGLIWMDISDEITLKDGKANPWGWSYYRMDWNGEKIGDLNSGCPEITADNIQMAEVTDPSDNIKHVFFFKGLNQDEWDALDFLKTQGK